MQRHNLQQDGALKNLWKNTSDWQYSMTDIKLIQIDSPCKLMLYKFPRIFVPADDN